MSPRVLCLAVLLAGTLAAGCGPGAHLETPPGFATLEKQKEYVYRSTSAAGVVIAIRREKNAPFGNLEFWADAVDRQLQISRYLPDGMAGDGRAVSGQPGRQLRYTREDNGRTYRFWVGVFVTEKNVWLDEEGGDKDRIKEGIKTAVGKAKESISIE